MPFAAYPDADAVESLLRSTGYWPTDTTKQVLAGIQAQIGAEAAKDEWERLTGWTPFLADETATARTFDSTDTSGYLDIGGAVEVESVSIAGVAQTLNSQYYPYPRNRTTGYYNGIQNERSFALLWIEPGQIEVIARWGRVEAIPGDVYQAILQKAALIVLTQIENLQSIASLSEDGFSKAYDVVGIVTQKDLAAGGIGGGGIWGSSFVTIAARWKRLVV